MATESQDHPGGRDLFADGSVQGPPPPLAERMRPRTLDEVLGQDHLTAPGAVLRQAVERGAIPSIVFWGPPGSGKTTLARILGRATGYRAVQFSAVMAGVKDIRRVVAEARGARRVHGVRTLLFVDEVHRFNKAQQDAFLPHVEDGTIVLIGATTENPSFEVNSALLSRCQVHVLKRLGPEELKNLARRALEDEERGLASQRLEITDAALEALTELSDGDARQTLNALETLATLVPPDEDGRRRVTPAVLGKLRDRVALRSDRAGEEHFNVISALHKSVRGSDPDAALYWLARMLESGQDPLYVARRLVRMASEDVGLADPAALTFAISAKDAVHFLGLPEGALALAQVTVYMALAPKSNSLETAYQRVRGFVERTGSRPVPLHLRNAPTRLMKELGYGRAYRYPHDYPGRWVEEDYLPEDMASQRFYEASGEGREARLWAAHIERIRRARRLQSGAKASAASERPSGPAASERPSDSVARERPTDPGPEGGASESG